MTIHGLHLSTRFGHGLRCCLFVWTLACSGVALCDDSSSSARVTYTTTADWETEFNGEITIQNTADAILRDWSLDFDFDPNITYIWDARITAHEGSHYTIRSAGWNDQIPPGGRVSFGFGGGPGNVSQDPQNVRLTSTQINLDAPIDPDSVRVDISQTAAWAGGFAASVNIVNDGQGTIGRWKVTFNCDQAISLIWGAEWSHEGNLYTLGNSNPTVDGLIRPGGKVSLGFQGSGTLTAASFTNCTVNGVSCKFNVTVQAPPSGPAPVGTNSAIAIGTVDGDKQALQFFINQGPVSYPLSIIGQTGVKFEVTTNNPSVVTAAIVNSNSLQLNGLAPGRAALAIREIASGAVRYVGVMVRNRDGSGPGMPPYVSIGSVSEDTTDHLAFWQAFGPGPTNKRVDMRYIYLNGGPSNGWDTWSNSPGDRASGYIQNSRKLGMIPFFVFYNIPDASESYSVDLTHVQDAAYMQAYFKNLKLALDIINRESPDDIVGIILEPDFIGYLAQNANRAASAIPAAAASAYKSGVLISGSDPAFPDTVQGVVQAINYTIHKYAPQVWFGWEFNLWASPPGGWTTAVPGKGLMHKTDTSGVTAGRPLIYNEAAAITKYYMDAGVATYGARFVSIDKYGLDAPGFEASAAADPANSFWFWNNDLWQNYLTFVRAMHETSKLPVILWQLPVGHINSSKMQNPYNTVTNGFPDLINASRALEDSTGTFFFGDEFQTSGARLSYFGKNEGNDPALKVSADRITWGPHLKDAAAAGVIAAMFGAGVGASTTNVGTPPTDAFWWITAVQSYYLQPVLLP